ncbi:MAG: serine--tRNA ligase [Alphaproteobacteria bacterium]|nr:serine--tRNA ligase [Alphaproteobacteria bacterium]
MLDIKRIRENPESFDAALKRRGMAPQSVVVLALDARHRGWVSALQRHQARRNEASKAIGAAKARGEDAGPLMNEVAALKDSIREAEEEGRALAKEIEDLLAGLPNAPAEDVPDGPDAAGNVELRRWGSPPALAFKPRQHFDLGEALGLMDFEIAAKLSGARFVVLKGALSRLERALAAFMLDLHTGTFGYTEVSPPYLVRSETAFGTGNLPKFAGDLFRTTDFFWLIPTAEMPLTNLVREQILDAAMLPLRFTAHTPCFRSEAGAAGKDTRGMIRQHQFTKVELVSVTTPETSDAELECMTGAAEEVLRRLGLPYRVVALCTGDMGFAARKTYDIEVWLPGQAAFREISSCSNCGDFQARRMAARYRDPASKAARFVHTLNGSGLAVGRTLIAVMENYQQADGSIVVPAALRPYLGGLEVIAAAR